MSTPFTFAAATVGGGVTTATATVSSSTAAGDALVVTVGLGGTGSPSVSSVTDTKGNTYRQADAYDVTAPNLEVWVADASNNSGGPAALTGSDSVTAHFSAATATGASVIGTDCPGVSGLDANVTNLATGTSAAPSVTSTGNVAQTGETAIVSFAWSNAGGTGTVSGPFTQLHQEHITSNVYTTVGYDVGPSSGSSLTGAASITSTAWRAIIISLQAVVPGLAVPAPALHGLVARRGPARGQWRGVTVRTVNAHGGNGQVQPKPVIARRTAARAYARWTPVSTVNTTIAVVVNQWALTFAQPAAFQTMPPALQSLDVALTVANSVGGGTGTPTAGNWLICLVGMSEQSASAGFTVGVKDDLHSYWRPVKVSTAAGLTRTSCWYTPNVIRQAGTVYVSPNGAFDAVSVLVIEVARTGPWDTLTVAPGSNYAAAATSLALSLAAPSAASFAVAAVTGDSTTAGQAFAPGGWTALQTVSASNGTDHTCDCVLTSAFLGNNSGSLSVSGSASSATDLSGVIAEFALTAPSPVPAGQNPAWAYMILEAAFGSGYETPEDQMTWTSLNDVAQSNLYRRFWAWADDSGTPYALGQLQSAGGSVMLDNADGLVSPLNPASLHYTSAGGWAPLAGFYDPLVTAGGPLAWWKLADASGSGTAADSSGNSHPGTATSVTFGNGSQAVTGDTTAAFASGSTSHITTGYNPALSAVTAECWVNLNGLANTSPVLLASSSTASDHKGFVLGLSGTTPQVTFGNGTAAVTVTAASPLPASGWAYLAATWDGATVTLYVNGVAQGTAPLAGSMPAGTATGIGLGFNPATSSGYLNGLLAEAAVYGAAAISQQIAARFTAGPAGAGTPVRVRMALGAIGGTTYNRWYTWSRNGLAWPEQRNKALRNYVQATLTDVWSVMAGSCPTPYRGEVRQDNPYAWWPMDDQPIAGGVQPATLRNAAAGNSNTLAINAASGGVTSQDLYSTNGTDLTTFGGAGLQSGSPAPSVAAYAVAQQQGWLYGDPQSSPASYATGNPVTSSPGSAAWQQTGLAGNTGTPGWFLTCNDPAFPPLSGGMSFGVWFNTGYNGSATGFYINPTQYVAGGQPHATLTIAELATASAPVAILYLDSSGHLILETFNAGVGTNHTVYSASDLRNATWNHVMLTTNGNTWTVYLNGGLTGQASGSGAGMTSAWTWLIVGADLGSSGGSTLSAATHMSNSAYSHAQVYPQVLPAWRVLGHYCAAITAFGLLPAPQNVALNPVASATPTGGAFTITPDGSEQWGNYGITGSPGFGNNARYTFSGLVVAQAGSYTSGPSARAVTGGVGQGSSPSAYGYAVWASWTGLAPSFGVYTAASASGETNASTVCGTGESYTSGFGSGASGHGIGHTAAGSGASPPASPSSLGDTVAQRVERILGYALVTAPNRAVDSTASLLVQAAADIGGQQAGANLQNLVDSDNGLLMVDQNNTLCYKSRAHLAADTPVWAIGMNTAAGQIPFAGDITWSSDPQRVWDVIAITPYSPDGASLASLTPAAPAASNAAQAQFGPRPKQVTSYLQDPVKIQTAANWLQTTFGTLQRRAAVITIDAATHPAAWGLVAAANPGDLATVYDAPLGQAATTGIYRISQIRRDISNGANGTPVQAKAVLVLDPVPASYWS